MGEAAKTGGPVDFREATTILGRGITSTELAERFGWPLWKIRYARVEPGVERYTPPPEAWRWEAELEEVARERATELLALADRLREQREASTGEP